MCCNKAVHVDQTKTPAGTEVTALWSARVYTGQEVAAVCRKCVSGLRHYLTVGFGRLFKHKGIASVLSYTVLHHDLYK